jgi:hypothetical protein
MKAPRVAYVSLVFRCTEGVLRKLNEQAVACKAIGLSFDVVWITSDQSPAANRSSPVTIIRIRHRSKLEFRIKQILQLNRITRQYDVIFLRYPLVDPIFFVLFSPGCAVVSEHHTKELEETKLLGDWRYFFEKYGARHLMKRFAAISAVTEELLEYEVERSRSNKATLLVPNSIDVSRHSSFVTDAPVWTGGTIKMAMVCTEFVSWHGLDKILEHLRGIPSEKYELHLCGILSPDQRVSIGGFSSVKCHGPLERDGLSSIYQACHLGLSCFALERKGMKEASTLKVREYLASGLPAVYGHHDAAFPPGFPYVLEQREFAFDEIRSWLSHIGKTPRNSVLSSSLPYISVESLVRRQYDFATQLKESR